ncbi:hypothetical protein CEP88_00210 (plasmid) [Roseobacter denitrificans]|uniref:VirB4 protein, putative n=1 Tax=Roseobacter denitrificans (strain ATCC 33942 / OCh 114) TaxID=375451 RepID=Q07GT1_ROSDO|nr:VirB4 protein, putative [Roseobacter denitrificans]ABI93318.1 VirB4 protein, putative [Roseobacter denitrificans OCh 114]AVL51218.1 hypothetical protein CEP88_00210 [Roseobacter denitrificans]SFG40635.1 type IV secretion system protein VirB4 [Roseobacter denitrificans OCh 114]
MLDVLKTRARKDLEASEDQGEHLLVRHLPYVGAVTDDVMMLRDGDLIASFIVEGIAADTASEADVDDLSLAFSRTVTQAQSDVGIYVHRFSSVVSPKLTGVAPEVSTFAAAVDQRWQSHIETSGLRSRQAMITVTLRPSKVKSLWAKFVSGGVAAQRGTREKDVSRLNEIVDHFMEAVRVASPTRLSISSGEWIGLLRAINTGQFFTSPPGAGFMPLADMIAVGRLDFRNDTFVSFGSDSKDTRYGAVFSIKSYPSNSAPGIFNRFDLPFDMVISQSYTPVNPVESEERISRTARQMQAADDAAQTLKDQLVDALDDVASGRIGMGMHHATITVFAGTVAELDEAAASIRGAGQRAGATVVREDVGARAAFFAQHPGNYAYRARAAMISSTNFADFTALHATPAGHSRAQTPWGESVTILPDIRGEPYRFNFHLAGELQERTVGHTLVIGMTGAGKTLGACFLLAQAARLNPRIIAFDKDQGMEMPLRALGADYAKVRMGEPTGFNPFAAEADERGTAWLTSWLEATLAAQGTLSATQREALSNATRSNMETDPSLRTMRQFRSQLRSVDDGGDLHTRLGLWDDGQYGWLFSGEGQDETLSFNNDVTAFDLTEIFETQEVRTAWLAYVFRRIERQIEDERPTIILIDEAWKVLDDPFFEAMLKDWALTLRKKNVVLMLMTQRVDHLVNSAAGGSILESCVTTLVYPNSRYTLDEVAPLNFTDAEAAFVTSSAGGQRLALIRNGDVSTVVNMDLGALGPLLKVLGGGKGESAPDGWRDDTSFWKDIG